MNKMEPRATTVKAEESPATSYEDNKLIEMGYKPELKRVYNTFDIFCLCFNTISVYPSIAASSLIGLESGPAALIWGWVISGFFIIFIGISMSMLATSLPTAGGLHYWTNYYAPSAIKAPLSFLVGSANLIGLCGGLCYKSYLVAYSIMSAVNITNDVVVTAPMLFGISIFIIILCCSLSCLGTRYTRNLQRISLFFNMFILLIYFIALPSLTKKEAYFNTGEFIFKHFFNFRDWPIGFSVLFSLLPGVWTLNTIDTSVHLSEELKSTKNIPLTIIGSLTISWALGFIVCFVIVACHYDRLFERLDYYYIETRFFIGEDFIGWRWMIAFRFLTAFTDLITAIGTSLVAVRQLWAFSRDDGTPFISKYIKCVNKMIQVPVNAAMILAAICSILQLFVLNQEAGDAMFSLFIVSNYLAYGIPILLVLLPYGRKRFVHGSFYCGSVASVLINIISICWMLFIIVLSMIPRRLYLIDDKMNYSVAFNCGFWGFSLIYFFLRGNKAFKVPEPRKREEHENKVNSNLLNEDVI